MNKLEIIAALSDLTEQERCEVVTYVMLPATAKERKRLRNIAIREGRHLFRGDGALAKARAISEELSKYISRQWKRDTHLSMLSSSKRDLRIVLLHRIARLNEGDTLSYKQIQRILENRETKVLDKNGL